MDFFESCFTYFIFRFKIGSTGKTGSGDPVFGTPPPRPRYLRPPMYRPDPPGLKKKPASPFYMFLVSGWCRNLRSRRPWSLCQKDPQKHRGALSRPDIERGGAGEWAKLVPYFDMFPQPRKSLETNRYGTQHGVRQTKIKSPEEYRNISQSSHFFTCSSLQVSEFFSLVADVGSLRKIELFLHSAILSRLCSQL